MPQYKAPLRDTRFLLNEVFDFPAHYAQLSNGKDADPATVDTILQACATYCETVLSPLYRSGDEEGCTLKDGVVTTPKGFKAAYEEFCAAGWQGLSHPTEFGGQGMPISLGVIKSEMMGTANWAFTMYPGLSLGAMNTILQHGSDDVKKRFMPALTSGRFRLQLDGDRIVHEERLLEPLKARIRDVRQGPDGYLYVLTDAPKGQLLRLGLASE